MSSRRCRLLDLEPHLGAQLGVQVAERLVEEEHRGREDEGAGQRHPLLLAAGQLWTRSARQLAHLHQLERRSRSATSTAGSLRTRSP